MEKNNLSKAWDWASVPEGEWIHASDELLPVALRWKNLKKTTVLDLGCGRGRLSLFLAELGFQVTAADLSEEGIEQLKKTAQQKNIAGITTILCDMVDLPFEKNSFDCVLAFHSIYHTTYENLKSIIAGIAEILKEKGRIFITFNSKNAPSFRDPSNKVIDEYTVIKTTGIEKDIPHTYLDYPDIVQLLGAFKIIKIQQIQDYYESGTGFHFFVEAEKKAGV